MPHPAVEELCLHQHRGREKERKERTKERERGGRARERWGKREGRKRREGGGGVQTHVISLLLTSPRAATKGGMLSYVLYRVTLPCFLSEKRERLKEQ